MYANASHNTCVLKFSWGSMLLDPLAVTVLTHRLLPPTNCKLYTALIVLSTTEKTAEDFEELVCD